MSPEKVDAIGDEVGLMRKTDTEISAKLVDDAIDGGEYGGFPITP